MDGTTLKLISGEYDPAFTGFYWTGSTWTEDTSIVTGLGDVGRFSTPEVFMDDTTLKLISGESHGSYTGFKLGFPESVEQLLSTIDSSNTTRGDEWTFSCQANDGVSSTSWQNVTRILLSVPEIEDIRISPNSPDTDDNLSGYCNASDLNGDTLSYNYAWYKNDVLNRSGTDYGAWIEDTSIVSGITIRDNSGTFDELTTSVFMDGSSRKLITGEDDGMFNGFYLSDTGWIEDISIVAGLPDIGEDSSAKVYLDDTTLKLITGNLAGSFRGFYWTGSSWTEDTSIVTGLPDVGYGSKPEVYLDDTTLKLITGNLAGSFRGFYWTGSSWTEDTSIVTGLPDVGVSSTPTIYSTDNILKLISGSYNNGIRGFYWTGSSWTEDASIVAGLPPPSMSGYSPEVYLDGSNFKLISSRAWGLSRGFQLGFPESEEQLLSTIDSSNTTYNEEWIFSCQANDGLLTSDWQNVTTIITSVPEIENVRIFPNSAYTDNNLLGYCNGSDMNGDSLSYNYAWYKNDVLNISGTLAGPFSESVEQLLSTIDSSNTTRGDEWIFSCQANDSIYTSDWQNTTRIILSVPEIEEVRAVPLLPYTDNNLLGYCNGSDMNGDSLSYNYAWYKNDVLNISGTLAGPFSESVEQLLSTIDSSNTTRGDEWIFSCQANDSINTSDWQNATSQTITELEIFQETPEDDIHFNTTTVKFYGNATCYGDCELQTATLYLYNYSNDLINETDITLSGTQENFNIDVDNLLDGIYYWNYEVTSTTRVEQTNNRTIVTDLTDPIITINHPASEILELNESEVEFNMTFYDKNLFGYNVTCIDTYDDDIEYTTQVTGITQPTINFLESVLFTNPGTKECSIVIADSHTAQEFSAKSEIKQDKIIFDDGIIEFSYDFKNKIPLDNIEIIERYDRISPVLNMKEVAQHRPWYETYFGLTDVGDTIDLYWTLTVDGEIHKVDSSKYPGHVVIIPNNDLTKSYWYDALSDIEYDNLEYEIINNKIKYHASFSYEEYAKNNYTFITKSLGGLNVAEASITFDVDESITVNVTGYESETSSQLEFNLTVSNGFSHNYTGSSSYEVVLPCTMTTLTSESSGYVNIDERNYAGCVREDYNVSFYQSVLEVNVINIISGNPIPNVEFNISHNTLSSSEIGVSGSKTYYLNTGSYAVNISKPEFGIYEDTGTLTYDEHEILNIDIVPTYSMQFKREETGEPFSFVENTEDVPCVNGTTNVTYYEIQQFPNTYDCIGNFSEDRACYDGVDAISSTYSQHNSTETSTTYVNYTKPTSSINSSYLSVKGSVLPSMDYNMTEYSDCYSESVLQYKFISNGTSNTLSFSCYNGSSWVSMDSYTNGGILYGQEMYWAHEIEEDNETICHENLEMQIVVQTFCADTMVRNVVNNSDRNIEGIDCNYEYWLVRPEYSTTSYFRMVIPDKDKFNESIYLLDLNQDSAIEVILNVNDISDNYNKGRIKLKKFINGTRQTVTEQYLDVESKVILWLDQNEIYELWIVDDEGNEHLEGNLLADNAGERYINIPTIPVGPGPEPEKQVSWKYSTMKDDGNVTLEYIDRTQLLNGLTWNVYDSRTGILVRTESTLVKGNHTLEVSGLNKGISYVSEIILDHDLYGTEPVSEVITLWQGSATVFPGFGADGEDNEYVSNFIKIILAIAVIIGVMLVFSQSTAEVGITAGLVVLAVFLSFNWFSFVNLAGLKSKVTAGVILGLGSVLAVFLWLKKLKRSE